MKKFYFIIVLVMLVDLTGGFAQKANDAYNFPVKRGTEQWNALKSYQDKRNACTLPESLLATISTKGLIEIYLDYPLLGDLMVFSTPQEGIRKLQENFNGARELLKRKDVATLLLEKYTSMNPAAAATQMSLEKKGEYSFKIMAIEILLAQESVLVSLDARNRKVLLSLAQEKLDAKKNDQEVYGSLSYSTTGWIMARILKQSNYTPALNSLRDEKYKFFADQGVVADYAVLDNVVSQAKQYLSKN
jgi:hypothetical protein